MRTRNRLRSLVGLTGSDNVRKAVDAGASLEEIIAGWQDELTRHKATIIAQLTQRIPELPPGNPQETPGASEADEGEHFSTTSPQEAEESLHTHERRSWLYRFFFGP